MSQTVEQLVSAFPTHVDHVSTLSSIPGEHIQCGNLIRVFTATVHCTLCARTDQSWGYKGV